MNLDLFELRFVKIRIFCKRWYHSFIKGLNSIVRSKLTITKWQLLWLKIYFSLWIYICYKCYSIIMVSFLLNWLTKYWFWFFSSLTIVFIYILIYTHYFFKHLLLHHEFPSSLIMLNKLSHSLLFLILLFNWIYFMFLRKHFKNISFHHFNTSLIFILHLASLAFFFHLFFTLSLYWNI